MKKVFSNHELPHIWASQQQNEGRANSMFFEGANIYSYGKHFCIARIIGSGNVLFTTRSYSVTTAKHISNSRAAVSHMNIIYCNDPSASPEYNFQQFNTQLTNILNSLPNRRKKENAFAEFTSIAARVEAYSKAVKISVPKDLAKLCKYTFTDAAEYSAKIEKANKAELNKVLTIGKKAFNKYEELFWAWADSETITNAMTVKEREYANKYAEKFGFTLLREKGGILYTSKGIEITVNVAKRYAKMYVEGKLQQGADIIGYKVNDVKKDYVTIGCHTIAAKDAEYILSL